MSSRRRLTLIAMALAALFIPFASGRSEGAAGPQITGVWSCQVSRPGSLILRPLTLVFHADGIVSYSSQTTINGGALALPFTSRGGGIGQWEKAGPSDFAYRAVENMYIDGNAGGIFYVDATIHLNKKTQQLCSGTPDCPGAETKLRLTQFTFAPDGHITGEVDLLPADSEATQACSPLSVAFPGLP